MRRIYLSPHLDDAILSCGGLIWEQGHAGEHVEIWTVCAGDPPDEPLSMLASTLHARWGTGKDSSLQRRQEDITACQMVKAAHRHLAFPECIYRRGKDGNWLYASEDSIFAELQPDDFALVETLSEFLQLSLRIQDVLVSPLTIGGHVDHQLTRAAAERLGRNLVYYADVPYVLGNPTGLESLIQGKREEAHPLSRDGLHAWEAGIAAYASQISTFWPSMAEMRTAIQSYSQGGIRLWSAR